MNNLVYDIEPEKVFTGVVKKGEIWNIEKGNTTSTGTEIWSNRPAIIVSNEATNQKAGFVNVVYLTTKDKREMPYHIKVNSGGKEAIAMCEQIFAVDKSRISFYIGEITPDELLEIDKALLFSLGISNSLRPNTLFTKWVNAVSRYNLDNAMNPQCDTLVPSDNIEYNKLIKERNQYKLLYEQEKQTVEKLMTLS